MNSGTPHQAATSKWACSSSSNTLVVGCLLFVSRYAGEPLIANGNGFMVSGLGFDCQLQTANGNGFKVYGLGFDCKLLTANLSPNVPRET